MMHPGEFERLSQLPVPDRLREKISLLYNPLLQRKFGRVEAQAVFEICRSLHATVVDYQKLHRLLWHGLCHGSQGPAGGTQLSEMQENMAVWDSNVQGVREKVVPMLCGISPFVFDADEFKMMFLGWSYRDDLSGIPKCFSRVFWSMRHETSADEDGRARLWFDGADEFNVRTGKFKHDYEVKSWRILGEDYHEPSQLDRGDVEEPFLSSRYWQD